MPSTAYYRRVNTVEFYFRHQELLEQRAQCGIFYNLGELIRFYPLSLKRKLALSQNETLHSGRPETTIDPSIRFVETLSSRGDG